MTENPIQPVRWFKTGATLIAESDATRALDIEGVRALLKHAYPEIAHATVRQTVQPDGSLLIQWLPAIGRKG